MDSRDGSGSLEDWIAQIVAEVEDAEPPAAFLLRRDDERPLVLKALPIAEDAKNLFGARALLAVVPLGADTRPDQTFLAAAFGLTPAESRLAAMLATGMSPVVAAAEIGIAEATVRQHLKSVFQKTGTHRQSELVALLARL